MLRQSRITTPPRRLLLLLQRRNRVHIIPAHDSHRIARGRQIERQIPIIVRPLENVSHRQRTDRAADVARHIHRAGERPRVLAAHVHARRLRARHRLVVAETRHADGEHCQQRTAPLRRERQEAACARESNVCHHAPPDWNHNNCRPVG